MGKLIVVEGIDASGKSTVVSLLETKLQKQKFTCQAIIKKKIVENIKENLNSEELHFFSEINNLIWGNDISNPQDIPVDTWAYLYGTWYSFVNQKYIIPNLQNFDFLLVDGWWYKVMSRIMITSLHHYNLALNISKILPTGNQNFLLLTSPNIAWKRRNGNFNECERGLLNNQIEYFQNIDNPQKQFELYQTKVQNNIIELMGKYINQIITNNLTISEVVDALFRKIVY